MKNVTKQQVLEEVLAMLNTCFEGKQELLDDKIAMELPTGEKFTVSVENAD